MWKVIKGKIQSSINNQKQYQIFGSKKLMGILLLFFFVFLFVVSIINVPSFTTIHSYTFGMLFGYYSYFIYCAFIYLGLVLLFNLDIKIERMFQKKLKRVPYITWISYLILVLGIALIIESSIIISKKGKVYLGNEAFSLYYKEWWETFISSKNPALPSTLNGGIIVLFFMSIISTIATNVITIITGIIFIFLFFYYAINGTFFGPLKNKIKQSKFLKGKNTKNYNEQIVGIETNNNHNSFVDNKSNIKISDKTDFIFTLENPFNEQDQDNEFIKSKTFELNQKEEKDKNNPIVNNQNETFEFELDVFNTMTSTVHLDNLSDEVDIKINK